MFVVNVSPLACTGCEACVTTCPTDVLRVDASRRVAYPAYPDDCQGCFVCVFDCPFEAIRLTCSR
ncbi:MAG: 4Fe-4S dicluster domain-containing protein [Chloroflexota bacterium]